MSEFGLHCVFGGLLLKGEGGEWMSLLVFAVVIALSAVSSIVKARKQKKDMQAPRPVPRPAEPQGASRGAVQRQQPAGSAIRPAQDSARDREDLGRPKPRSIIRPAGALGAFVAEIKAEIKRAADEMQGRTPPTQHAAPELQQSAKVAIPPAKSAPPQRFVPAMPQEKVDDLSEIVPLLSGPDDLRRAIVYCEILGRPVSLRKPGSSLIGP